jgi:hypothetical protein
MGIVTRRDFLQTSAALAAFAMASPGGAAPFSSGAEWFDRPMRWAQLNLVEDDVAKMDRQYWLGYFRTIHADALCLSAGGVVAFYPTKIQYHHRSKWLKGHEDFWPVMLEGCRKQNMVVLARTDPHATYDDVAEAHPDWISVGPDGKRRPHPDYPGMWLTCTLGPYNLDFMTEVTQEIAELYDIDGIFANRWTGNGMCYCEHCRQDFRTATVRDLGEVGRRDSESAAECPLHCQLRRRSHQRPEYEKGGRAGSDAFCRPAMPRASDGALGQWQER